MEKIKARIDFDLDYLRDWSPQVDFYIVAKTAWNWIVRGFSVEIRLGERALRGSGIAVVTGGSRSADDCTERALECLLIRFL